MAGWSRSIAGRPRLKARPTRSRQARITQDFSHCVGIEVLEPLHEASQRITDKYNAVFRRYLSTTHPQVRAGPRLPCADASRVLSPGTTGAFEALSVTLGEHSSSGNGRARGTVELGEQSSVGCRRRPGERVPARELVASGCAALRCASFDIGSVCFDTSCVTFCYVTLRYATLRHLASGFLSCPSDFFCFSSASFRSFPFAWSTGFGYPGGWTSRQVSVFAVPCSVLSGSSRPGTRMHPEARP